MMRQSAKTISPYTDPAYGNRLNDYPALKHFFKCNETSGTELHCAKTGLVWTPQDLAFDSSLGTVQPNSDFTTYTNDTPVSNGSWATFPAENYLFHMFVLRVEDYAPTGAVTDQERMRVRCRMGYLNAGQRYGTSCRSGIHVALTGTNGNLGWITGVPVTMDIGQIGTDITVISKLTPFAANGTDVTVAIEVLDQYGGSLGKSDSRLTAEDLPGSISPDSAANWSGGKYYGSAWFSFENGFPSNIDTAVKWMAAAWRAGDRIIYPSWIGKT